uniref:Uncharacterized protein n=1 Tax=Rhizophora mucronata TaxID=61149 RepID=A0A2P2N5R1_RHIMU
MFIWLKLVVAFGDSTS